MKQIFRNLFFSILGLGLMALSSCQKNQEFESIVVDGPKPVATFTNTSGSLKVKFTNSSSDSESTYWLFGDGASSTEDSPVHTFAAAGNYTVVLKTNSEAGYSSTISKDIFVAGPAGASYSYTPSYKLFYNFTAAGSSNLKTLIWDFGDGTTSTEFNVEHTFPAEGTYTVSLTVNGLLGDVDVLTKEIIITTAEVNLLKGSEMEVGASGFWTNWSSQNSNPPQFGYIEDKPVTGTGACLRFPSFTAPSNGSKNHLIYQGVNVVAGAKYKLSAQVKIPAGGYQEYIQFYITKDANTYIENTSDANTNHFLCLNTWHGWNSVAINGDLLSAVKANGSYGLGAVTDAIYTATSTQTVFIGIQVGSWSGYSNGDVLIDEVKFIRVE